FLLHSLDAVLVWLKRIRGRLSKNPVNKVKTEKRFWERFRRHGALGIFLVAALPYAGGALSGSILAVSLKTDRRKAFFIITAGCILGSVIFHLGFTGILALVNAGR
ncbi:MAG: small multi-drug export protein, partial [Candidatus Aminicenantes bacterium]|nr:small multi-drug export protein [Candidatus Aminicenantes bacterium]